LSNESDVVVDVCGVHFDLAGWEAYLLSFAAHAPGYLRKFGARFCDIAGGDPAVYAERLAASSAAAAAYLIECGGFHKPFEAYEAEVRAEAVSHQILHGWGHVGPGGRDPNRYVAECAHRAPDLFSAWAGVSLREPESAARQLESSVKELGHTGLSLTPFLDGVAASDPRCRPVFEKARELGLPVWLHTGQNFNNLASLDLSHIRHADRIAAAFPELVIILGHAGWPWMTEAVALCQRHDNVYVEFSSHRPAHMPQAGSGWAPMLLHAKGAMRRRVMFGSASWVSPKSIRQLAEETRGLPAPADVTRDWLGLNACRALNLSHIGAVAA